MKQIIVFFCIVFSLTIVAQTQSGSIKYQGIINKKHVDSFLVAIEKQELPMHVKQAVVAMYRDATPDEYVLNFKNEESYYYYEAPLEEAEYNVGSKAGKNSYYNNNKTNSIIEMGTYFGNIAHAPLDWELTNKTKNIGDYKCYQAVAVENLYSRQGHFYSRKVTAWFTPQIPLNFGPKHYNGLPGLILEVDRGEFTITATELVLNPEEDVTIKRVNPKDRSITQEEANKRMQEVVENREKNK